MESDTLDSSSDDLDNYFEEEEEEISESLFIEKTEYAQNVIRIEMGTFTPEPEDYLERLLYFFYFSAQYLILSAKTNGDKPIPDVLHDSDETLKEKAYFIHLFECFNKFNDIMGLIAISMYNEFDNRLKVHLKEQYDDHTLAYFMGALKIHKELHSRRIKSDPSTFRTKVDDIRVTYNTITKEKYNPNDKDHKSWRLLIINPLPSDYNYKSIDPHEGGNTHELNIEISKLNGTYNVPKEFSIIVTTEWDKVLRLIHTTLHFDEYMHTYIVNSISVEDLKVIQGLNWKDAWKYLFKDYYNVKLDEFSREKKKTPSIVFKIAELRDLLKEAFVIAKI